MHILTVGVLLVAGVAGMAVGAPHKLRAGGSNYFDGLNFAVDAKIPILYQWTPRHTQRGATQEAVHIVVRRAHDDSVAWDSGRVNTSAATALHAGPPLTPGFFYDWTVAFFDNSGTLSPRSTPARFLLAPSPSSWDNVKWLGSNSSDTYRGQFEVPHGTSSVVAHVVGLGYSSVTVDGQAASNATLASAAWTNYNRVVMYSSLDLTAQATEGTHVLGVELGTGWRNQTAYINSDYDQGADNTELVLRAQVAYRTNERTNERASERTNTHTNK